ncbi:MAG: fructosamine kinase family protein [Flavobacteriales bacterium]|jgi:fructosamine-3-kinase|nr:fructosamine kinase family protein [Flavobacteriales bacterium]
MAFPAALIAPLAEHLSGHAGRPVTVAQGTAVGGGSINDAYRLDTSAGPYFVKVNAADRFPSMFAAEADGLKRLEATGAVRVPAMIATGEERDGGLDLSFILLEWVEEGLRTAAFWAAFGRGLAALHRHTAPTFGLEVDNYIGSLRQVNTPEADWPTFFIRHRLEPQLRMARDRKRVEAGMAFRFERLFHQLDGLFPTEPPALLHGDLWRGNFLCDGDGRPVLIDPAVYYGHREMDIAMTRLFGGFDPAFLAAYQAEWPLEPGWEERLDLCQLYPLLVHVNLFGGGYVARVEQVLRRFA